MKSSRARLVLGLCLTLAGGSVASADVRLPSIFSDHMVLQQNKPIPIWGWADPGEEVTVAIEGKRRAAVAGEDGKWKVMLDSRPAGGPYQLVVRAKNSITVDDVLVGEVWICSGQSNMEWPLKDSTDGELEVLAARYPRVRLITMPHVGSQEPQEDFEGEWQFCTPETAEEFSAVGYYFGRQLQRALDVPVGLIANSWGGSACEAWVSRDRLEADSRYDQLLQYWDQKAETYDHAAALATYEERVRQWKATAVEGNRRNRRRSRREPPFPKPTNPLEGQHRPANLYNGVLRPIMGYGIRGVIWYQGESNTERAYQYRHLFPLMVQQWRDEWNQGSFPFYWVQLANYKARSADPSESAWAELREAQSKTRRVLPNTGEVVTIDIGEADDIHPRNKREVGQRLARWTLALDYGFNVAYDGPRYTKMEKDGNKIRLRFAIGRHADDRLERSEDGEITGFAIAGKDRKFVWAQARVLPSSRDGQVEVWSDDVPHPVAVRYAWADNPECNLRSEGKLPVAPFRTDDWPGITVDVHAPRPDEVEKFTYDPSGTWKWEGDFNGTLIDYTLRLHWKDNALSGIYQAAFGIPELDAPRKIIGAQIDGNEISFAIGGTYRDGEFTILYSGRLENEKIVGTAHATVRGERRRVGWNAQRIVETDDVVGRWNVKLEGPNGLIESGFTLQGDGDALSGTFHSSLFGDTPISEVALNERELSFVVVVKTDDNEFTFRIKAEPRGDKVSGVMLADFGGDEREMRFAGAREASGDE